MIEHIEYTILKPTCTQVDIEKLIAEAIQFQIFGICIPPYWVRKAHRDLQGSNVKLVTVAGFPFGYSKAETKLVEIKSALDDGADEVDTVLNISAFKTGVLSWAKVEVAQAAKACHEYEKQLKVILETAYLTNEEIVEACKICADAGADFVKTSTGYAPSGASVEVIKLMKESIPAHVGIKASGGIKTKVFAKELIVAGADRIGTSTHPSEFL